MDVKEHHHRKVTLYRSHLDYHVSILYLIRGAVRCAALNSMPLRMFADHLYYMIKIMLTTKIVDNS